MIAGARWVVGSAEGARVELAGAETGSGSSPHESPFEESVDLPVSLTELSRTLSEETGGEAASAREGLPESVAMLTTTGVACCVEGGKDA